MRRLSTILVLFAWLLASGAQWDLLQSFAWGRMIANYSRTMPLSEAIRLTFTADNLCDMCAFVADARTRVDLADDSSETDPKGVIDTAKAKAPIAPAPLHVFVFGEIPEPNWPRYTVEPDAIGRPAPPVEPPRVA